MTAHSARTALLNAKKPQGLLAKLHSIQIGGKKDGHTKIKRSDLVYILRNLATLVENGLALPKALETLAKERSLQKYSEQLDTLRKKVESGESFSGALKLYPESFSDVMVNGRAARALIAFARLDHGLRPNLIQLML